jgi:hypothetical protein
MLRLRVRDGNSREGMKRVRGPRQWQRLAEHGRHGKGDFESRDRNSGARWRV